MSAKSAHKQKPDTPKDRQTGQWGAQKQYLDERRHARKQPLMTEREWGEKEKMEIKEER
jgi:hypothetical protein